MSKQKYDRQFVPVTMKEILRSELKFHLEFHLGTSNNPLLCGVIRITPVIWVVSWVFFQKRGC